MMKFDKLSNARPLGIRRKLTPLVSPAFPAVRTAVVK